MVDKNQENTNNSKSNEDLKKVFEDKNSKNEQTVGDQSKTPTPSPLPTKVTNSSIKSDPAPIAQIPNTNIAVIKPLSPSNVLVLPVIPIREGILFPNTEAVLTFGRKVSLEAIKEAEKNQRMVILLAQKTPKDVNPKTTDLFQIGTLAIIDRTITNEDNISALVRGIGRIKIQKFIKTKPVIFAQAIKILDIVESSNELKALSSHLQKEFQKTVQMGKPVEFLNFMKLLGGVTESELADQVASTLNISTSEKQEILETLNVKKRLEIVIDRLSHEVKVLEIEKDVVHKTQEKFDKHMKENILRERLRTIQKELGEIEDDDEVENDYKNKLKKTKLPLEVKKKVEKEIKRLKQMSVNNPESGYIRTWIDTIFELPWNKYSNSKIDLQKAKKILDKNHFGLEEVKDRILEYMAVLELKQKQSAVHQASIPTILCFIGPPGVGKTSIGKSIAETLGRKFTKISLGGIRDEAEIRGHRRTYVGAMSGRIIKGMIQAKTLNPVFILDEVDKIGSDFRGDPSSALLEVLDPEQNSGFEDHYLDIPFDLSKVMFITTANSLDTIPPALKDRLEIINYSGYTHDEKHSIAKNHLIKKVVLNNGLKPKNIKISDQMLANIIQGYTREAGVRDLERILGKISRKIAKKMVEEKKSDKNVIILDNKKLDDLLGPAKYDITLAEKDDQVGLSTGLAWTSVGGDMLFIEVALSEGEGKVVLTGKLGEVMRESAQTAYTFVKSNADKLKIDYKIIKKRDIHIHVPEGAVPKDGPSAGITIATAIVSAFSNKKVRKDIAMTGEITLRGRVLPIGGLKEKLIAAHRGGIKTIIIPKTNEKDLVEIPDHIKKDLKIIPVFHVDEVLKLTLI